MTYTPENKVNLKNICKCIWPFQIQIPRSKILKIKMPLLKWQMTWTCPYNMAHQILPSRMARHLFKCRRQQLKTDPEVMKWISCPHSQDCSVARNCCNSKWQDVEDEVLI